MTEIIHALTSHKFQPQGFSQARVARASVCSLSENATSPINPRPRRPRVPGSGACVAFGVATNPSVPVPPLPVRKSIFPTTSPLLLIP